MSGLTLSMLCRVSVPMCSVFDSNIKRIVRSACHEELPLLRYILSQTVVPNDAFKWFTESKGSDIDIISYLIKQHLLWDKKMEDIIMLLETSEDGLIKNLEEEIYSCTQLDNMLEANRIYLSIYEKIHLFNLLIGEKTEDTLDQDKLNKLFPFSNIIAEYIPTQDLIHEAFFEAVRLADHKMLQSIKTAAEENGLYCVFNPECDPHHQEVLSWIEENIVKGCRGENLGWSEGPDSAKWPSTELKDYVKTLDCLCDIMR